MSEDMRREQQRQAWETVEIQHLAEEELKDARRDAKVAVRGILVHSKQLCLHLDEGPTLIANRVAVLKF